MFDIFCMNSFQTSSFFCFDTYTILTHMCKDMKYFSVVVDILDSFDLYLLGTSHLWSIYFNLETDIPRGVASPNFLKASHEFRFEWVKLLFFKLLHMFGQIFQIFYVNIKHNQHIMTSAFWSEEISYEYQYCESSG